MMVCRRDGFVRSSHILCLSICRNIVQTMGLQVSVVQNSLVLCSKTYLKSRFGVVGTEV